ncbi:DUF4956 domain-containing protein [Oribacterium sp. WCC10]|uniref:DUF4956 domain-containing protein n=1 Tax=Oribacterium sp. WCC10 TaxID=1855343 RepID=UPI0008EDEA46|nr:DUF4956 domain-containing protein [Oribacterium sp. WCC10]SFG06805.1 Uncharacterized membrane protein YhiD, involved in acid resistance [Oribacterium sp. WCC10]
MLDSIINGSTITAEGFMICLITSLVLGAVIAAFHSFKNRYSKNFLITLVLLPAIIQSVIMLVNGNVGTGVAVMGAFSLVRFRSLPGNSREIASIFLAMAVGLATGMGYIILAAVFTVVIGIVTMALVAAPIGETKALERELKVVIPENLDYAGIFDDVFETFTEGTELIKVKTVNMGSLYELIYHLTLKDKNDEKKMIDDLRARNGNLEIVCGRIAEKTETL